MLVDSYGFFAACRKIACLSILLAFSSSAQAIFVTTPVDVTFEEAPSTITEMFGSAQENSFLIKKLTITNGSAQTKWSIGDGDGEPKYGRADFISSTARSDATTVTVTLTTMGETVVVRYKLRDDPAPSGSGDVGTLDQFDVIIEDDTSKAKVIALVGIRNNPPIVRDSKGAEITDPTSVGISTATYVVGGVSTAVFTAYEKQGEGVVGTAPYLRWSIYSVNEGSTVSFSNGEQTTTGLQATSEIEVVYRSSQDENIENAGYTLVVKDTIGRAATVTVSLIPEPPVISTYEGSPVENGVLSIDVRESAFGVQGFKFRLSAEYACPTTLPACLKWNAESETAEVSVDPTAAAMAGAPLTVTVQRPDSSPVSFQVKVRVLDNSDDTLLNREITVNVTVIENMPPEIVSIDGRTDTTVFTVSTNLETVRFPVVAADDFEPESLTWEISNAAGSGKGTASFVVGDGMLPSTTARGTTVVVSFVRSSPVSTTGSSFTLTVMDTEGLMDTATVTVNPSESPTIPTQVPNAGLLGGWRDMVVMPVASSQVVILRAEDFGLGEKAALEWEVTNLDGLDFDSTNSKTMGSEGRLVFRLADPRTQLTGRFTVEVTNSYGEKTSRRITLSGENEPPVVTYRVGDVSSSRSGTGGTIALPESALTMIMFSADDPIGQPVAGSTFTWTLVGQDVALTASFVGVMPETSRETTGKSVVVQFVKGAPGEESSFIIEVSDGRDNDETGGNGTNRITVNIVPMEAGQTGQLRVRTFLGGAVR